ncbi:MAG: ATP synthase F1 subunit gamma [Spirochaetota bacterium]
MATQREILKRIKSVKNTQKITKTMEMVSTAKMKKMQDRIVMSKPYGEKLETIIDHLRQTGVADVYDPLMQERPDPNRILVFMVTGNRGLCGGFNTRVIENTINFKNKLTIEEGKEVLIYSMGKKGTNYFRFIKQPVYKSVLNPEDKFKFEDASKLGDELINLFVTGEVDEVYVSYTKIMTRSTQKATITRLLPLKPESVAIQESVEDFHVEYIFEPNPYKIFSSLLPLYIKMKLYLAVLESGFSEHFARRVAMKNATDAAKEMVRDLTITYNRARQAKITKEISEIVGGAAALE